MSGLQPLAADLDIPLPPPAIDPPPPRDFGESVGLFRSDSNSRFVPTTSGWVAGVAVACLVLVLVMRRGRR